MVSQFIQTSDRSRIIGHCFAPGSFGNSQDSEGGDGCTRPSPLFSLCQRRRICRLSLSRARIRQSDAIAFSSRSLNCSLSKGSKPWICHWSAIDPMPSRAFFKSLAISFIDVLRILHPLGGGVFSNQSTTRKSLSDCPSEILRFQRFFALGGMPGQKTIIPGRFSRVDLFRGPKGPVLPKNTRTCPKTGYESGVVRQSHRHVRCSQDGAQDGAGNARGRAQGLRPPVGAAVPDRALQTVTRSVA